MTEIKPLPREIVEKLEEAGISRENEIFYHQHQWVYQKKLASMTDFPHCGHPIDELGPFGKQKKTNVLQAWMWLVHLDVHSVDVSMVLSPVKSRYTVTRVGHTKLAEQNQPIGTHSPLAEITLEGFARSTANIPDNATHFCWLYPPRRLPILDELQSASFEEINLLKIGGFAYFVFDRDSAEPLQLVRINSLIVTGKNGIVFDGPFMWNSNYNDQLWSQNRFHVRCFHLGKASDQQKRRRLLLFPLACDVAISSREGRSILCFYQSVWVILNVDWSRPVDSITKWCLCLSVQWQSSSQSIWLLLFCRWQLPRRCG